MRMPPLNLPAFDVKIARSGGRLLIYDFLRRRNVALTPEEWVRQHFVHFLVERKGYPSALLANEVGIGLNGMIRRCDSVLYDRNGGRPRLIAEYKAPHVALTQEVFNQISAYNMALRADYLIVSNGLMHVCGHIDYGKQALSFLQEIPAYEELA